MIKLGLKGKRELVRMRPATVELSPRTDGNPVTDTSPLEALEWAVLATQAKREELEETLRVLPRWRFVRRRAVERTLRRRRVRERHLHEALTKSASQPRTNVTA